MKVCMVGSGRMARVHSRCLREVPGVTLDTVVSTDTQALEPFADEFDYRHAISDLHEALGDPDLDAVVICTPNALHASQSALGLRAGKHVLCEIPLALSLQEGEKLTRLAEEKDLTLMVCHTERFRSGRMELAERIASGALHPKHVMARFHMLRRGRLQTDPQRKGWVDNLLWHHGCHAVDAVLSLLGGTEALELHAQFGPPWPSLGLPIDIDLQWCTPADVLVNIALSHNAHWGVHDYRFICLEDTVVCDHGTLRNKEGILVEGDKGLAPNMRQAREFVDAVREGREPLVSGKAALSTLRILQKAWDTFYQA
ncbi:MAG: Gfo/Idh/MocA family oxidoreductase [Anaerolineae bacterium]